MTASWQRGDFLISTDRARLDETAIHDFISNKAYWGIGRSLEVVRRSLDNSLNFGLYRGEQQIGFARVVTDYATFAWLCDVFILPSFRGKGLSKWLLEVIVSHPQLQGFRRWLLATKDAHELYRGFGFADLANPKLWMERFNPDL